MSESTPLTGPDFTKGIALEEIPDGGSLLGQAGGEAVLLVRHGDEVHAIGATCSHYGAPLAEGLVVGHEVRCPWHHARFDVRTGEAVGAPALTALGCWEVERRQGRVLVAGRRTLSPKPAPRLSPESVLIVGAGAAGNAAAEMLRTEGYPGPIAVFGVEGTLPVDRPNLSKDTLAGTAPAEWASLRSKEFYAEKDIEVLTSTRVTAIDPKAKRVTLADGSVRGYGALLLATGSEPIKLTGPGADKPHVLTLRTLADCNALIERAKSAKAAVVVGASFIGLEVAASLRARGLEVHVVAPDKVPFERILGPEVGAFVKALHEEHGVRFHLGHTVKTITDQDVTLDDGSRLEAQVVAVGIGVRPSVGLAEAAGLRVDRGVLVDEMLETSAPGLFAAGDIARWPDARTGTSLRVEHWAVAERQGQTAARNMLGRRQAFRAAPFFWSQHYDLSINYVGSGEGWDRCDIAGNLADKSAMIAYRVKGRIVAIATVGRDKDSLQAEVLMERGDQPGLEALLSSI